MNNKNAPIYRVLPVLFGFFVMGLVDLVGIATNYVKVDFSLTDTVANLLPTTLFLWFAILSVPTGLMMNKFGRKRTVILSMVITLAAMLLPLVNYHFATMLVAFTLLGIGNTIIQVSLNPLLTNVVSSDCLTSSLTMGQFIKAIASFMGPVIASFAAKNMGDWKLVFLCFGVVTIISGLWLALTHIHEQAAKQKVSSFGKTFGLLNDGTMLMFFMGILFLVGIDVGMNTTIPKFLMEQCGMSLNYAGLGTSLYFIARTMGSFVGAILLVKFSSRKFFIGSMLIAIPAFLMMLFIGWLWLILAMVFVIGLAVANVFSIIFAAALKRRPEQANEVSGLLITGVAGGAVVLPVMGVVADIFDQTTAMSVLVLRAGYLLYCAYRMKEQ